MLPQKQQKIQKPGDVCVATKKTFFSRILYFQNKIEIDFSEYGNIGGTKSAIMCKTTETGEWKVATLYGSKPKKSNRPMCQDCGKSPAMYGRGKERDGWHHREPTRCSECYHVLCKSRLCKHGTKAECAAAHNPKFECWFSHSDE